MADKNIQIKNLTGDNLFPKTKGAVVINNAGDNLGGVEAGAQVNVLEGIKIDGVALTITNKIAEYTTPAAAEYSIAKQATAETGYAATYYLTKDGVQTGEKINIAKDQVLDDVDLLQCTVADTPIAGLEVGDWYFDFTFQNKSEHIYLAAKDLTDVYTAGNGLTLTNGEFAINTADTAVVDTTVTENSTKLVQSGAVYTAIDTVNTALGTHTGNGDIHVTAAQKLEWSGKQDAISDLATIRSNATAGKGAADTIATYGDVVTHNASEFQTAINSSNKLDADLVDDSTSTNKFVTATDKTTWNGKQDALSAADLARIAAVDGKAEDNAVVHLSGAETITGAKTFSASPIVPTASTGDSSTKAASTAFVQGEIAGLLTYVELA